MANREFENKYIQSGYQKILGIDEAGRGCLAGPLVVAGVILPNDYNNDLINDSKQLTEKTREMLYLEIITNALSYHIEIVSIECIDEFNILGATTRANNKIIQILKPDYTLTDYVKVNVNNYLPLVKGDEKSISIAAASILAKVTRDHLMVEYAKEYQNYDFANNKGYGTKKHLLAIDKYGICPIHRKTFEPIKTIVNNIFKE
jgi:ribonuclease HII